jgi:hypothetical protein
MMNLQKDLRLASAIISTSLVLSGLLCAADRGDQLGFEANFGQTRPEVRFTARSSGGLISLTADRIGYQSRDGTSAGLTFLGANPHPGVAAMERQPGVANYLLGRSPEQWYRGIPRYGRIHYGDVYPGIDVEFYGVHRNLEFDFIVRPEADPSQIRLAFVGGPQVTINKSGDAVLQFSSSILKLQKPQVFQAGVRLAARYLSIGRDQIGIEIGPYDRLKPVVIDPVLTFSSYLGGASDDEAYAVAVDANGNSYIAGTTSSVSFPAGPSATIYGSRGGNFDAFVAKFNSAGTQLAYVTYIGGSGNDEAYGVAVDSQGSVYVTGYTSSSDFPTTAGAYQTKYGGGTSDAFLLKLNPAGSAPIYSTLIGGSGDDLAYSVALDSLNEATIGGSTTSGNLALSAKGFRPNYGGGLSDGFVIRLNAAGTATVFGSYIGGGGEDVALSVAVDGSSNTYVTGYTQSSDFPTTAGVIQPTPSGGYEAFVTALNSTGGAIYSTYLGGAQEDYGLSVAVDSGSSAYVAGYTASSNFPVKSGALQGTKGVGYDAFVAKLNVSGTALVYCTFLGGSGDDFGQAIAVDGAGNAYIAGESASADFPKSSDAANASLLGSAGVFVSKLDSTGAKLGYSTLIGGSGFQTAYDIAVDSAGAAYVAGYTTSLDFPVSGTAPQVTNGGASDGILFKLVPCSYSLNPTAATPSVASSTGSFQVTTGQGCSYTAVSDSSWLQVTSGTPGSGTGNVNYSVSANASFQGRTGTIRVAGQSFTVTQAGVVPVITAIQGSGQSAPLAVAFSTLLQVKVTDSAGTPLTNLSVTFTAPASGASGTFAGNGASTTATTNAQGLATASTFTANSIAGTYNVTASVTGVATPAMFTMTNVSSAPAVLSVSPSTGTGGLQTFVLTVSDPGGASRISSVVLLLNKTLTGTGGCFINYNPGNNSLLLANDTVTAWLGPSPIGSGALMKNSQCTVKPAGASVTVNGNTLAVSIPVTFTAGFAGAKTTWGYVADIGADSGYQAVGNWTATAASPQSKIGIFNAAQAAFLLDSNGSFSWDGAASDEFFPWGGANHSPKYIIVTGDWNGSGSRKIGIFDPATAVWLLDYDGDGVYTPGTDKYLSWGSPGDIPVVGDWNSSGTTKIGTFGPNTGLWLLDYNGNYSWDGAGTDKYFPWGSPGDTPLVGDWNGTGTAKVGTFGPNTGLWLLDYNGNFTWDGTGTDKYFPWGSGGDTPVVGDWNGSGTTKIGTFGPRTGLWLLDYNGNFNWDGPGTDKYFPWGSGGDTPVVGDWSAGGSSKIGTFGPGTALWLLDYNGNFNWDGVATDKYFPWGSPGDTPVILK